MKTRALVAIDWLIGACTGTAITPTSTTTEVSEDDGVTGEAPNVLGAPHETCRRDVPSVPAETETLTQPDAGTPGEAFDHLDFYLQEVRRLADLGL